ncbi:MAG: bifunctional demethylmenaquinone methyltransferase/2-methoxy-6-polyprenyl-1,4-benzoquinol methylase UbiE [Bacteroidetes bacterium]|nr:bifunctional demethylmenaquinone methyltransferase/2-methoxy-6-polyprenyl-1,4-benzoquinol methylase UbiE [Bacteroidota bacterium]
MKKFAHDHIVPNQEDGRDKKEQVADMFDSISKRYDFLNRFLSMGIDVSWRKKAIRELSSIHPKNLLDVATGTGDMAILAYKILRPEKIIGIDISQGMLEAGEKKIKSLGFEKNIELKRGDSETINFPDNSFEGITVAFGVRNFEHLEKGLGEMRRVLKPGGKLVILEFTKPHLPVVKNFYTFYMRNIAPGLGSFFSGNKKAYSYLHESVQAFPEREEFLKLLQDAGFRDTNLKMLSLGICAIYCGYK